MASIFDKIADAGEDLLDTFGDAAVDLGSGVVKVATEAGNIFVSGGVMIIDGIDQVATGLSNLIRGAVGIRQLRPVEIQRADDLFKGTVPYGRVVILSIDGIGGKPFCIPGHLLFTLNMTVLPLIGPLLAFALVTGRLMDKYLIFMGPEGYRDALNYTRGKPGKKAGQYLAHELTHVWQGEHDAGVMRWDYVFNSVCGRVTEPITGVDSYDYKSGFNWNSYGAEQQANIVDDFWRRTEALHGMEQDANWPYIRDVIRPVNPDAKYRSVFSDLADKLEGQVGGGVKFKPAPMTQEQANALAAQAAALRAQGEVMVRSGNLMLVAQGQAYINTANQIEAAIDALGLLRFRTFPGSQTITVPGMGSRTSMTGSMSASSSLLKKK